jgi:hypothetical protein
MLTYIEQLEQMERDLEMFAEYKVDCDCRPQLVNAGTGRATIKHDTYGCPEHCEHIGINTYAREWKCACGAWGDDKN